MKKHISLLICLVSVLFFASCKDWLDVSSTTQLDRDELLSSEGGYSQALKGVYSQMSVRSLYGGELTWGLFDVISGGSENYMEYDGARQFAWIKGRKYVDNATVAMVDAFWSGLYGAIAGTNAILEEIDGAKNIFSNDNYSLIKGEAMGLRAFLHFELFRMYGDIYEKSESAEVMPFVTELTSLVTPMLTGKNIMTIIVEQLEEAVELLENDPMRLGETPDPIIASAPSGNSQNYNNIYSWHNRRLRFNYYAAKATLARAYLWMGKKELALQTALELIGEQSTRFPWVISSNVSAIEGGTSNSQDRTFATEHIFALNITNLENYINGFLNTTSSGSTNSMLYYNRDMYPTNEQIPDPRCRYLFSLVSSRSMLNKYNQPTVVYSYFKYRMPMIRISEMYYIAAECAATWQEGLEYLETVRKQRGMASLPLGTVNSAETLEKEIMREYRKEFQGEGQLWYYYKRHQYTTMANVTINANYGFPGVHAFVFPLPDDEILYGDRE